MPVKILFVCMGNICRSPTAEAVLNHQLNQLNLTQQFQVDSAGTHRYHIGHAPDVRAIQAGRERGYQLEDLVARQITEQDFEVFDYIVAMDRANVNDIASICPSHYRSKISLLLEHIQPKQSILEVPDPYYGGESGFQKVIDLIESGTAALLDKLRNNG